MRKRISFGKFNYVARQALFSHPLKIVKGENSKDSFMTHELDKQNLLD
jgi:hypothetical protein